MWGKTETVYDKSFRGWQFYTTNIKIGGQQSRDIATLTQRELNEEDDKLAEGVEVVSQSVGRRSGQGDRQIRLMDGEKVSIRYGSTSRRSNRSSSPRSDPLNLESL